jgi:[ribosomal protein S18]-alanine N-acetyltransferase
LSSETGSTSLRIRKMQQADLECVVEIDHASFSLPWPPSSFVFELQKNPASRCWVAELENESGIWHIAGMLVAWMIVDELHIATIATASEYRQKKIGRSLMTHALTEAAKEGAVKSFLEVRRSNAAARQMYRSLGYQEDGVRLRYYQDNHEDAILMSLQNIDPALLV